jgi:hypothetical protein
MTRVDPYRIGAFARAAAGAVSLAAILFTLVGEAAAAQRVPLPRPRPAQADAADVSQASQPQEPAPPSACRLRLTLDVAIAPSLPPVVGDGECGVEDPVRLEAVLLPDRSRVAVSPPATVRCTFAEALVHWIREDVAPAVRLLATSLRSIESYTSYDCRSRNRVLGAKLSEHGKGNAVDLRSIRLANGTVLELTDPMVAKNVRERLRSSACTRFKTVLGPGSDGYHENHVHVDLAERRSGHRMCQWDVREPGEEPAVGDPQVPLPRPRPTAAMKR